MYNDIRKKLDKVTGELIESFVNFDKEKVLHFQTGLHAIQQAREKLGINEPIDLHSISDLETLKETLKQYDMTIEDFNKVPSVLSGLEKGDTKAIETLQKLPSPLQYAIDRIGSKEASLYEVPIAGMIAVTLKLVSPEIKNALLAGQAGERALRATERASSILSSATKANKESVLRGTLYDYKDQTKPASFYIENNPANPQYLVAAKATNNLAELLESGIKLAPHVKEEETVKNALKTLKSLSIKIFSQASSKLKETGSSNAAEEIGQLANYLSKQQREHEGSIVGTVDGALMITQQGLDKIKQELEEQKILTPQEAEDFKNLVSKRLYQIRESNKV